MVEVRHVSKAFGDKTVLADFSLALAPGRVTCVLGPSGCGKTTLLRVMAGLLAPDGGQVVRPDGQRASFVFQEDRLLPWFDALANLRTVGVEAARAHQALAQVRLGGEAHALPHEMSGGMQRRLAIARALAYGGDVFFLDEPMRGLDIATAEPVLAALRDALRGKTALLITHSPEEALALGDEMLCVGGPPVRVLGARPRDSFADVEALKAWIRQTD